jgi:hypothetical protein
MSDEISKSPERGTYLKEAYLKRCAEQGVEPDSNTLATYDYTIESLEQKWDDPNTKVDNMEYDLLTTEWILDKVRNSESYAQNLYAAMCNNEFIKNEVWPILSDDRWSCSWRSAGGIISDMLQEGDYIDWYCSGMGFHDKKGADMKGYVPESLVTDEIRQDLLKLGWIIIEDDK